MNVFSLVKGVREVTNSQASLPVGRGALVLGAVRPLPTEVLRGGATAVLAPPPACAFVGKEKRSRALGWRAAARPELCQHRFSDRSAILKRSPGST